MDITKLHPADAIVEIMNRLYRNAMTTTSGGNLSIMDEDGSLWISPSGVDKCNLTRADIMQVKPDGTIIGPHKPSSEYPFHLAIYRSRPDIRAVLHAHPPALVAFSVVRRMPDTTLIPGAAELCGKLAMAKYAVPGSETLGAYIAEEFAAGASSVMLENHGVVVGAANLFRAFMMFETLDYCARIEINIDALGARRLPLNEKHRTLYALEAAPMMAELEAHTPAADEQAKREEICRMLARAYRNQLVTSAYGTYAVRIDDGGFLITPNDRDRLYLEPDDLIYVKDGACAPGTVPSHAVRLVEKLFAAHPEFNAVMIAHAPYISAFALTDGDFDARLIPESYIMLKHAPRFPYGANFLQPDLLAQAITPKEPVCIVENDCVITAGTSILNAFDRLEVMEYSARAIVFSTMMKEKLVKIGDEDVRDIEVAFHL